jgi:hypothetical protein
MGSHTHNVVCPDFVDDQEVVIVTTNQESSRTALHAPLIPHYTECVCEVGHTSRNRDRAGRLPKSRA